MNAEKVLKALVHHVPAGSVDYCMEVWHRYDFDFRLRKITPRGIHASEDFIVAFGHFFEAGASLFEITGALATALSHLLTG